MHHAFHVCAAVGVNADANADGNGSLRLPDIDWEGNRGDNFGSDDLCFDGQAEIGEEDDELVAPHAGHSVGCADGAGEAFGKRAKDFVAGQMAKRIVYILEAVDIDEEQAEARLKSSRALQGDLESIAEQDAVGQAGEGIVFGQVAEALLAIAQRLSLLIDLAAENEDPSQGGEGDEAGEAEGLECVAGCPPGGGVQDVDSSWGVEEQPERVRPQLALT